MRKKPVIRVYVTFDDDERREFDMPSREAWDKLLTEVAWAGEIRKIRFRTLKATPPQSKTAEQRSRELGYGSCGDGCGFASV